MQDGNFDVIVIGAGPGGASCAALLAKRGLKALLLEQNPRAGGKALSVTKGGFTYEMWPVAGSPVFNGRFDQLMTTLGLAPEHATPAVLGKYYYPDRAGIYRSISFRPAEANAPAEPDPAAFGDMMQWLGIADADIPRILQLVGETAALTDEQLSALDDISYHEYVAKYALPRPYYSFLGAFSNVAFVEPIDQVAASEFIRTERDLAAKGSGYYTKGGYSRLFDRCTEAFRTLGGVTRFGTRVNKIVVGAAGVRGVETDQGVFSAPIVVSNAGIQPTVLKLAGPSHFPESYVARVKALVPSLALLGTRYFLRRPVLDEAVNIVFSDDTYWTTQRSLKAKAGDVPEELLVFNVVPSNYDPKLAPAGRQCVLSSTLCHPDPGLADSQVYWDRLDRMMERVWPGFQDAVEHREHFGTRQVSNLTRDQVLPGIGGECIGLGQIVGQCGKHKPNAAAPIPGLFYVGCDAGGYGVGTHQAVDSGFNVAAMVEAYHRDRSA